MVLTTLLGAFLALTAPPQVDLSEKLSAHRVRSFALTPDEAWLAYVQANTPPSGPPLAVWSVPLANPDDVRLLSSGISEPDLPVASPDSTRFYFFGGAVDDLLSVPVDGLTQPTTLVSGLANFAPISISTSPSQSHVVAHWYNQFQFAGNRFAFFRADGSGSVHLDLLPPSFNADSSWVVNVEYFNAFELFGAQASDDYSNYVNLAPEYSVSSAGFSHVDDGLVFVGAFQGGNPNLLYKVTYPGGVAPQLLSSPGVPVIGVLLTPDRATAVYLAYASGTSASATWYRVPVDGSLAPTAIGGPITSGGETYVPDHSTAKPKITPDGLRLVYRATSATSSQVSKELFSLLLDGSEPPTRLTFTPPLKNLPDYLMSEDGSRAVYRSDVEGFNRYNLYSVPVDGSSPAVKLSGTLVSGGSVGVLVQLAPRLGGVLYVADAAVDQRDELWYARIDGSSPPRRVSGALQPNGDVSSFVVGRLHVYYMADQELDNFIELYRYPLPRKPRQILR